MKTIGLITCNTESDNEAIKGSCIKRAVKKVREFFISFSYKKFFANSMSKIALGEDLEIIHILLPYNINDLKHINKRRIKKINRYINETSIKYNLTNFILPDQIGNVFCFDNCTLNPFQGDYLFKCMLEDIINEIYFKRGIEIWNLDITIVQGCSRAFLYDVIELLSPMVRFLTVISDEKEAIEEEAGEAFLDSGLAVIITNDWKNTLKKTDLILNLGDNLEQISKYKMNNDFVIINFSSLRADNISCNGILINGISIKITQEIKRIFSYNNINCFSDTQIAELLLFCINDAEKIIYSNGYPDINTMKIISKAFKKRGFKITGLKGRHGMVDYDNVNLIKAI